MKKSLLLLAIALMTACRPVQFTPQEYPIAKGFIVPFDLTGKVQVTNGQASEEKSTVYSYGGSELFSTLKILTEAMVQQTQKEIAQNSVPKSGEKSKSIELKVDSLLSKYAFMYWNSSMKYTVKLGNGKTLVKTVEHTSGILSQDLNGCIADGVAKLLSDPEVKAYLAE